MNAPTLTISTIDSTKKKDEEGRYGFGTTPSFDAFTKTLSTYKISQSIVLCVNLATLIRNQMSLVPTLGTNGFGEIKKTVNYSEVVKKAKRNMSDMANEFGQFATTLFPGKTHHILFYLTDPTKQIPVDFQRPRTSKSMTDLDQCVKMFAQSVKSGEQKDGTVMAHVRMADKMRVPSYVGLAEAIKEFTLPNSGFHLISHEPLDYHVALYSGRSGTLYRSHTGEVVTMNPASLGKVVFKDENIPFYPSMHILLGDKTLIKGILGKKDRDRLLDLAKTNHWNVRGKEYVDSKIKEYSFTLPYSLR